MLKPFSGGSIYHCAIFSVFILLFWQKLFVHLFNFFNSCDFQTAGLICVLASGQSVTSRRLELVVTTVISLFTQVSLMFLCKQLLENCDLLDNCHMSFNLHKLFWLLPKYCGYGVEHYINQSINLFFLNTLVPFVIFNLVLTYNIVKIVMLANIQSVIDAVFKSEKLLIPRASVNYVDICSSTYSNTTVTIYPRTRPFIAGGELYLNLYYSRKDSQKTLNL